jgi:anti-anti-sigma factor
MKDQMNLVGIELQRHQGCTVIRCVGRVVLEQSAAALEDAGMQELSASRRVILDLSEVARVDARGLGAIARLCRSGMVSHRPVVIVGASARLHRLLEITQLDSVVDLCRPDFELAASRPQLCGTC